MTLLEQHWNTGHWKVPKLCSFRCFKLYCSTQQVNPRYLCLFCLILLLIFRIFQWSWILFFIVLFSFFFFFLRYQSLSERKVTLELAWKNLNKWKFEPTFLLIYLTAWLVMPEKHSVLKQDSKFIACARRNLGVAHPPCCDSRVLGVLMFFMLAVTLVAQ